MADEGDLDCALKLMQYYSDHDEEGYNLRKSAYYAKICAKAKAQDGLTRISENYKSRGAYKQDLNQCFKYKKHAREIAGIPWEPDNQELNPNNHHPI